ncbi:hypothetical protein Q4511_16180 [Paracoccus sp. 1_MG-2023]|uniref:hypothetical protein n=1 Tax=Paracoccus sp. C2R09 TaxID=2839896 RepID=UPI001C08292F|nr:hypothetical protein [Paracoccus sp. C2R09]MBU2957614.1 hypothetical protein [Paracoccus sp. C2R09]MDO6670449.1 hypothetical protein [Paracoccus sp. 1_MG-2023]
MLQSKQRRSSQPEMRMMSGAMGPHGMSQITLCHAKRCKKQVQFLITKRLHDNMFDPTKSVMVPENGIAGGIEAALRIMAGISCRAKQPAVADSQGRHPAVRLPDRRMAGDRMSVESVCVGAVASCPEYLPVGRRRSLHILSPHPDDCHRDNKRGCGGAISLTGLIIKKRVHPIFFI